MPLRLPKLFNLRADPFENADIAADMFYKKWRADRLFMLLPAGALVQQWLKTLAEFRQGNGPNIGVSGTCSKNSNATQIRSTPLQAVR